jgi:hypothetical protein
LKTPHQRRDGARPAVPPDTEVRPADGPDDQSVTSSARADPPPADGQSAPNLSPRQKRLASKAAHRARRSADDAFREKERERVKKWRLENRDKTRAQKRKARSANYHRPFVAIDSEGQNYPDDDILYDGVRYPKHETYLWGAAADDDRSPVWLTAAETHGLDKRPLEAVEILDWLLDVPSRFGPAVYVMFSFGYDMTQILRHLPYKTVWEIVKRETFPNPEGGKRKIGNSPVLWGDYAIRFTKGKSFEVWKLADPDKPYKDGRINKSAYIRIYDVFGFFQSSFSAVAKSMVDSNRATPEESAFIAAMKDKRDQFEKEDIQQNKAYTTRELRLLARMMGDLRKGFEETDLHLRHWHGAGAAAAALIEAEKLKALYGPDIAASNITPQQDAAHHAYFGGRIELLKQGYVENVVLHVYDIASAYPAAMVDLPSLAGGKWINRPGSEIPTASLAELRKAIEATSPVSMFKIKFQFPTCEKDHIDARKAVFIPLYPLPYRQKGGGILFPASGYGWFMRDDVLAAIAWLERFVPDFPRPRKKLAKITAFNFDEAWIFEPRIEGCANERPFDFVLDRFEERRRIKDESERSGKYDIREKAIKLSLNSIYGKLAQSVGGVLGKPEILAIIEIREEIQSRKITEEVIGFRVENPKIIKSPPTANPYYAAATTACCRRRLIEAAINYPYAIVFFATDGIVSTRPLGDLARVRKKGDVVELGDWEYSEADGGLFVQPGVYTYGKISYDETSARTIKPITKMRGADPKKYDATMKANQWLIENVLAAWRKPFDPRGSEDQFPRIVAS